MDKSEAFLYQEIAESLRRRIASGELKSGDRLPPVREMAQQWGCTPGTISRAYAQLAREGLVVGHRGGGTRVTSGALQPAHPTWQWATLVNRAEQFLLEAISSGNTPAQVEAALSVAISRWQEMQVTGVPQQDTESPSAPKGGLCFAGSHDLTVDLMARLLKEQMPTASLSIEYVGSLGGLMALAQGQATVGLGIHAAAAASGLTFVPLTQERYDLVFSEEVWPSQTVQALIRIIRSAEFKEQVNALGGYDTSQTGQEIWVS